MNPGDVQTCSVTTLAPAGGGIQAGCLRTEAYGPGPAAEATARTMTRGLETPRYKSNPATDARTASDGLCEGRSNMPRIYEKEVPQIHGHPSYSGPTTLNFHEVAMAFGWMPGPIPPDPLLWQHRIRISGAANEVRKMDAEQTLDVSLARVLGFELRLYAASGSPNLSFETAITRDCAGDWKVMGSFDDLSTSRTDNLLVINPVGSTDKPPLKWARWSATSDESWTLEFALHALIRTF